MNGIINVYKEKGYTSHDVVAKLRGVCHQKKIGHTGTLDPDAEGVLPVCLGTATKVCDLLTEKDKEYAATLLLGVETDTQDITGTVLKKSDVTCSGEAIEKAVLSFVGGYAQIPPMYSALKVNGKKLCDLAREGIEVERKARQVQIYDIQVEQIEPPRVKMRVHCSKGTYIRTLCHDIGALLGCGGCMESLLRTKSGMFGLEQAYKLAQIQELALAGRLKEILQPVDSLFMQYPAACVSETFQKLLVNGNRLPKQAFFDFEGMPADGVADCLRVYSGRGQADFFGIYEKDAIKGDYKPLKIFWQR